MSGLAALAGAPHADPALAADTADIKASVDGKQETIGKITVETGIGVAADYFTATFEIADKFSFLDESHDFRRVNVETEYKTKDGPQDEDPVVGKLPAIDPGKGDGPWPFSYNGGE